MLQNAWVEQGEKLPEVVPASPAQAALLSPKTMRLTTALMGGKDAYRISWFTQFYLLLWRQLNLVARNKFAIFIRVFMAVMFSLILGAIYSKRNDNQKSIQDRTGLLFACTLNQTFGAMVGILNTFVGEKHIVARERASKSYRL